MPDTDHGSTSYEYELRSRPQDGQVQYDYQSSGAPYEKKKMSTPALVIMIVSIVIGSSILITIVLAGILYMRVISITDTDCNCIPMTFEVEDAPNKNDTVGCFFLIRAAEGVDLNPMRYTFYVAQEGFSPKKLNLSFRDYSPNGTPVGGDRNATYRYDYKVLDGRWPDMATEEDRERWNDGESIGFDMPTEDMGIDVVDGNVYEVLIKNRENDILYRGTFVYKGPCRG